MSIKPMEGHHCRDLFITCCQRICVFRLLKLLPLSSPPPRLLILSSSQPDPLLSPSLPTLLLFECVLVYMAPEASSSLIQWFVDYFSSDNQEHAVLGGIVYEMFGLNDSFGRVMLNNLKVLRNFKSAYISCAVDCRRFSSYTHYHSSRGTYCCRVLNLIHLSPLSQIGSSTTNSLLRML
jgi:hypothetical protein